MKKLILILFSVVAFLTACKKENIPSTQEEVQFTFSGTWHNPDISYIENSYDLIVYTSLAEYHNFALQQTIEFVGDSNGNWQGCFLWQKQPFNPESPDDVPVPDSVYFKTNDAQDSIELYIPGRGEQYKTSFRIVSGTEMKIGDETFLKQTSNSTAMVSLPNRNWSFDWHDSGFYFTGDGRMLEEDNPTLQWRGSQLYVLYEMKKNQAVRPQNDYNTLQEKPHGWYIFAGLPRTFEEEVFENDGVQQYAMVQHNGGNWCDKICDYAFAGCKDLNVVVLGNTEYSEQEIGDYAFYGCSLTDIYVTGGYMNVSPTAFDDWQYKHTVIHVEKGRGVPGEWDRFKHVYDDIVGSPE